MVVAHNALFVASPNGGDCGAVTKINLPTGALAGVFTEASGFCGPQALAVFGDRLFVGGADASSLSVLNSATGAQWRQLKASDYRFYAPAAMAISDNDLFVADTRGSLTELNASTGVLVRVLSAPRYGFSQPSALAFHGGNVFVANPWGGSITEVRSASGALVRVIAGSAYQFERPDAMAIDGDNLFVANAGVDNGQFMSMAKGVGLSIHRQGATCSVCGPYQSVTELNASSGSLVRVFSGPKYQLQHPDALAIFGHDLFVANLVEPNGIRGDGSVVEIDLTTGATVRVISGPKYNLLDPDALALVGRELFVADADGGFSSPSDGVTEINAVTGALVRVISGPLYKFYGPKAMVVDDGLLFVANTGQGCEACATKQSVTVLNPSTGTLVRVIPSGPYELLAMAATDGHLFVAQEGPHLGSVVEIEPSTGSVVRVITGSRYDFDVPDAIASSGGELFVANSWATFMGIAQTITELTSSTGSLVRVFSDASNELETPDAMICHNGWLYVANSMGDSVTVLPVES